MESLNRQLEQLGSAIRSLEPGDSDRGDSAVQSQIKALSKVVEETRGDHLTCSDWVDNFASVNALFTALLSRFESDNNRLGEGAKVQLSRLYKEFEQLVTAVGARLRQSVGEGVTELTVDQELLAAMQQLNVPLSDNQLLQVLEAAPDISEETADLIRSLLPVETVDEACIDAMMHVAERHSQSDLIFTLLITRVIKGGFLYTPVYRRYRLAEIAEERRVLKKKLKTRKEQLRARYAIDIEELDREEKGILERPKSASAVLRQIQDRVPEKQRALFDASLKTVRATFEQGFRHFQHEHQAGDVYLRITTYGFANLYAQLGGLPDFFTHTGVILRDWQDGVPCYFIAEYTRSGFNVAPLSHIQQNKNVLVRPNFPVPTDFDHGTRILDNLEGLGPHAFDVRMSDQLRDADNVVRLYCTEFVHYVFKHQFQFGEQHPSPFDGINTSLRLNEVALHNASCIGQKADQVYYVPDDFFHSPEVRYVGHGFPWAALPEELDQSAFRARMGRQFNRLMTGNAHSYRFKPLRFRDRLMASLFRLPSRSKASRRVLEFMSPENFGGKVFIPVENNRQGDYFLRFAGVAFSFEGAWKKACTLEDGSKNPRWREDFEAVYQNKILPSTHALFDRPADQRVEDAEEPQTLSLVLRGLGGVALQMLMFAMLLLIPAGTWQWPRALQYIVVFGMVMSVAVIWLAKVNPEGLRARLEAHVSKRQVSGDRRASFIMAGGMALYLVAIPLDVFYLQLLPAPPEALSWLGLMISLAGWLLFVATLAQNEYAVPVVRDQQERGQELRDKGLYGVVRHPMYLGMLLGRLGLALWLQSTGVALAIPLLAACFIPRIRVEERTLLDGLAGYREYCARVRYKVIPRVW